MRITYKDLQTKNFKQLVKSGFKEDQILSKLSNLYLKESRQLIINPREGLTISKALQDLKKGRVRQGVYIHKTALSMGKADVKNLNKLSKYFGKDSLSTKLLDAFKNGEINVYQLNKSANTYLNNLSNYETKGINEDIELMVEGYNI